MLLIIIKFIASYCFQWVITIFAVLLAMLPLPAEASGPIVYAPSLVAVILALVLSRRRVLRSSGQWIWIPGTSAVLIGFVHDLRVFGRYRGLDLIKQQLMGEASIITLVFVPTLGCILYSATMFLIDRFNRSEHTVVPHA